MASIGSDQKDRLNSGYASTAKKQRNAIQSIAEHIRTTCKTGEEGAAWVQVQKHLLENLHTINELHKQHMELYPKDKDDGETGP